jgi:hypothetical protein
LGIEKINQGAKVYYDFEKCKLFQKKYKKGTARKPSPKVYIKNPEH